MALILDADSLIKLNRVGVLELVASVFECIIPQAVYQEAVVNARAGGYADADTIDAIVSGLMHVRSLVSVEPTIGSRSLGAGEIEVLALASQSDSDSIVVSDDQGFLNAVRQSGIKFMMPIAIIPLLAEGGTISVNNARELIESFQPMTNERSYVAALADLEALGK